MFAARLGFAQQPEPVMVEHRQMQGTSENGPPVYRVLSNHAKLSFSLPLIPS